jgi:hypothetical protein
MEERERERPRIHKYGKRKTIRIMIATARYVISGSGLKKFQAAGFIGQGLHTSQRTPRYYILLWVMKLLLFLVRIKRKTIETAWTKCIAFSGKSEGMYINHYALKM